VKNSRGCLGTAIPPSVFRPMIRWSVPRTEWHPAMVAALTRCGLRLGERADHDAWTEFRARRIRSQSAARAVADRSLRQLDRRAAIAARLDYNRRGYPEDTEPGRDADLETENVVASCNAQHRKPGPGHRPRIRRRARQGAALAPSRRNEPSRPGASGYATLTCRKRHRAAEKLCSAMLNAE